MRYSRFFPFAAFLLLLSISCNLDGGPGGLDPESFARIRKYRSIHPRLFLTDSKVDSLRGSFGGPLAELWQRYLDDLPAKLETARNELSRLGRGHGNLAADLAFAWRVTGADSLHEAASGYLERLMRIEVWDPELDLLHGHLLLGAAIAYDCLYPEMNRARRSEYAMKLGDEAQKQYEMVAEKRAWYRNQYLQNHGHVNLCGLAYAAAVLYGEDARAQQWLAACDDFFTRVFELSPPDGTSIEGLSYGNYALEFCLFYAELARRMLGRDYYSSPWLRNYPSYIRHSLLPSRTEKQWAMTFGDSPRHGNYHGPEHQLFRLASEYHDSRAQWLGLHLVGLGEHGLDSASWWSLLWYDPSIEPEGPAEWETLGEFSDIGQVMMRSSWQDTAATLIGLKCGPFLGLHQADSARWDLGAAHGHPDAGSFQIFSGGSFLAVDPGYTYLKLTENHSTMLFKGKGQLGAGEPWFAAAEALRYGHKPLILDTRSTQAWDYALSDLAPAYHPALGVDKALRHLVFVKPSLLLVADEIALSGPGVVHEVGADSLRTAGGLASEGGYITGPRGEAWFTFDGPEAIYRIAASYIDNSPGSGSYSIEVNGRAVHTWQDTVTYTDTHLELTERLHLQPGTRISFTGGPMGDGARLVKLSLYGPEAENEARATWLLHLSPGTVISRRGTCISCAHSEGGVTDVYPLSPAQRNHDWREWSVPRSTGLESTMRLEISPVLADGRAVLLNLIHLRHEGQPSLEWLRGSIYGSRVSIRWYLGGVPCSLELDLAERTVEYVREN